MGQTAETHKDKHIPDSLLTFVVQLYMYHTLKIIL